MATILPTIFVARAVPRALDPYSTWASTRIVTLFEACPPFAAHFSHSTSGSPGT